MRFAGEDEFQKSLLPLSSQEIRFSFAMPVFQKPLSLRQEHFVKEYILDWNGVRAATAAGYKAPNKSSEMLLKNHAVMREIEKRRAIIDKKFEVTEQHILERLFYAITRTTRDFIDPESGKLFPLHKLSDRAAAVVDGIEQESWFDDSGNEHHKTKLKLMSLTSALDLAVKIKGMGAPIKIDINHKVVEQWHDQLDGPDEVEEAISAVRKLSEPVQDVEQQGDGTYSIMDEGEEL